MITNIKSILNKRHWEYSRDGSYILNIHDDVYRYKLTSWGILFFTLLENEWVLLSSTIYDDVDIKGDDIYLKGLRV